MADPEERPEEKTTKEAQAPAEPTAGSAAGTAASAADTAAPSAPDTTAVYLARRMCIERGYSPGTAPEAKALADASDLVLTKADGMSFQILCIIDREADPTRTFGMTREAVMEAARACLKYTGTVNSVKLPVGVQIWEVGLGAAGEPELRRLRKLSRSMPGLAKVFISTWAIDPASARVASTARFNGLFAGRRYLERLLREPRLADRELVRPPAPNVIEDVGRPWMTGALVALLSALFVCELVFGVRSASGGTPDVLTLVAMGGLRRSLVLEGEWYRLFTAAFLHGGVLHLLFNGTALVMAGVFLEGLLGRAWLLAIFVIGALGGSALSLALNPASVVSVGASGAIMGMLTAGVVTALRMPPGPARSGIQGNLLYILIPSLIPLATHRTGGQIDYASHLGGAVAGALVGWLLLRSWPHADPLPRFRRAAQAIVAGGLLLFIVGFALVARDYHQYADAAAAQSYEPLLIPNDQLPTTDEQVAARAADLVARYPRDPRARLFHALKLARAGDPAAAQQELRRGLEEPDLLRTAFPERRLEAMIRAFLAELLLSEGNRSEAEKAAAPVCKAGPGGSVPEPLRRLTVCP